MTSKTKIFLENRENFNPELDNYHKLFISRDYERINNPLEADLIVFTGGEDVSPSLYGAHNHPKTLTDAHRDDFCEYLWFCAKATETPCVGICRGAQFLHVMNEGYLVQDVDNHSVKYGHNATPLWMPKTEVLVSSTHHQMMGYADVGELLMYSRESTRKEITTCISDEPDVIEVSTGIDPEAIYYPSTNSISYQPHPEYAMEDEKFKECADAFFFIINNYLKDK